MAGYALLMHGKAGIAQLVEYKLPKLGVAGSNPVARSSPGGETVGAGGQPVRRGDPLPPSRGPAVRGRMAGLL